MQGKSGRTMQRSAQAGTSAKTDSPNDDQKWRIYICIQYSVAGDQPYRQICSIGKAHATITAATNQIVIVHRIDQNSRASGVRSCSLYALELKIFNPFPLPDADKKLNLIAMMIRL